MRSGRGLLSLVLIAMLAACGDDGETGTKGELALADGTRVEVRAGGGLALLAGDRELLAVPDSTGPRVHRFTETFEEFGGLWSFTRQDETFVAMHGVESAQKEGDAIVVRYSSPDGSHKATLTFTVLRPAEATLLRVSVEVPEPFTSLALPLRCDPDAGFYGFGEQYNAADQRGEAFTLFVSEQGIGRDPTQPVLPINGGPHTTYFPMPYFLDPRGFGVLIRTARRVDVDLCRSDPDVAWFDVIDDAPLEAVVFHGPRPLDVIRQLGDEVGRPKRPPDWAFSPWIAAQGGAEVVRREAAALQDAGIPVGALWVQDWTGIRRNFSGGFGVKYRWVADQELYPDLAGLIAELKAQGLRFLLYANPFVDVNLDHFSEMNAQGLLIHDQSGKTLLHLAPSGTASHPDLTNPAAREYVKRFLRSMVTDLGADGWMHDFGEWLTLHAVYADGSDPVEAHDRYPVEWYRLAREVMDEVRPDGDWVLFARAGFTGVQRVAMLYWTGDQETSFGANDGVPTVIPAMLNLGMSGIPYVTHDIGGFSSSGVPPRGKELFLRWTELGAFTPVMRTHQGDHKLDNWQWNSDAETVAHFRRFARIHEALRQEFQALAAEAEETSAPILRHLMLVFPDDRRSRGVDDQFMIGDSLLVAPVLEEGATTRRLYLPPGEWYDVWSGEGFEGPADIMVDAPVGRPPVFSRGSDRPDLRAIE